MDDTLDLDAIERRAAAATAGPWAFEHTGEGTWGIGLTDPPVRGEIEDPYDEATRTFGEKPEVDRSVALNGPDASMADAAFIAHARTDVPALVAECRRLRAERVALLAQFPRCTSPGCDEPATWATRRGDLVACDEHPDGDFRELAHAPVVRALRWPAGGARGE